MVYIFTSAASMCHSFQYTRVYLYHTQPTLLISSNWRFPLVSRIRYKLKITVFNVLDPSTQYIEYRRTSLHTHNVKYADELNNYYIIRVSAAYVLRILRLHASSKFNIGSDFLETARRIIGETICNITPLRLVLKRSAFVRDKLRAPRASRTVSVLIIYSSVCRVVVVARQYSKYVQKERGLIRVSEMVNIRKRANMMMMIDIKCDEKLLHARARVAVLVVTRNFALRIVKYGGRERRVSQFIHFNNPNYANTGPKRRKTFRRARRNEKKKILRERSSRFYSSL